MSGMNDFDFDSILGNSIPNQRLENSNNHELDDLLSVDFGKGMATFDAIVDEVLSSETFSDTNGSGSASPQSILDQSNSSQAPSKSCNSPTNYSSHSASPPHHTSPPSLIQNVSPTPPPYELRTPTTSYTSNSMQYQIHQQAAPVYSAHPVYSTNRPIIQQAIPVCPPPKIIQATPVTANSNIILLDSAKTIKATPGQTIQIQNSDGTFQKITIPHNLQSTNVATPITTTTTTTVHTPVHTVVQIPSDTESNRKRPRMSANDYRVVNVEETSPDTVKSVVIPSSKYRVDSEEIYSDEELLEAATPKINYGGRTADKKLSKDEISALENEGLNVQDYVDSKTWTKSQERVIKRIRRKIRNKKSAHESRRRKKEFVETLQQEFQDVKDENVNLRKRINQLESQNTQLKSHVSKLKAFIAAASQRTAQATTCVMLLVISLAFFLAPNYGPLSLFKNQQKADGEPGTEVVAKTGPDGHPAPFFVSRRILQLYDDDGKLLDEPIINEPDFGQKRSTSDDEMEVDDELKFVKLESKSVTEQEEKNSSFGFVGAESSDISGQRHRVMSNNLTQALRRRKNFQRVEIPVKREFSLDLINKPMVSI